MKYASDGMPWEDMEDAAARLFHVWMNGGEFAWAQECWEQ